MHKKIHRKYISLAAALLTSAALLTGCGAGQSTTDTPQSTTDAAGSTDASKEATETPAASGTPSAASEKQDSSKDTDAEKTGKDSANDGADTIGEGAAPKSTPEAEDTDATKIGDTCTFHLNGSDAYQVVVEDISYTDRRSIDEETSGGKILLITYTYQSLNDDPALVDDMSFRCSVLGESCDYYPVVDQLGGDLATGNDAVTGEVAYEVPVDAEEADIYIVNTQDDADASYHIHWEA